MRNKAIFFSIGIIITVFCSQVAVGQAKGPFEVPQNLIEIIPITNPKCPIKISGPFRIFGYRSGGLALGYTYENISNANIESFEIEELNWFDSRGYKIPAEVNQDKFVFGPGQRVWSREELAATKIAPYDLNIARESGVLNDSNRIWLIVVVKVKLADGTVYDGTEQYKLLTKFINDLNVGSHQSVEKLRSSEAKLREFISNKMALKF